MKLIVIDPYVTLKAPTMRSWVRSFDAIQDLFEEIEIWASECDVPTSEKVQWIRFPQRVPFWGVHALDFQWRTSARLKTIDRSDTLVMVSGCNAIEADIHYMHYWNLAMLREQKKRSQQFPLSWYHRLIHGVTAFWIEKKVVALKNPQRAWWCVSRSLALAIQQDQADGVFEVLPNPFDHERFCEATRLRWRGEMRQHYELNEEDLVLVFSSFGHFERKGLLQAMEAFDVLRKKHVTLKFLILGGDSKQRAHFRGRMKEKGLSEERVLFAGLVTDIERHLSAADALLFPSHFEAFSLAEIEAAALGLRLYLTKHFGVEMILREPVNGRLLPWDSAGMVDIIDDEITSGQLGRFHQEQGEAMLKDDFEKRLRVLTEQAIERKLHALS